jgi:hypothetical protein
MLQVDCGGECILLRRAALPRVMAGKALFQSAFYRSVLLGKNFRKVLVAAHARVGSLCKRYRPQHDGEDDCQSNDCESKAMKFPHRDIPSG